MIENVVTSTSKVDQKSQQRPKYVKFWHQASNVRDRYVTFRPKVFLIPVGLRRTVIVYKFKKKEKSKISLMQSTSVLKIIRTNRLNSFGIHSCALPCVNAATALVDDHLELLILLLCSWLCFACVTKWNRNNQQSWIRYSLYWSVPHRFDYYILVTIAACFREIGCTSISVASLFVLF